MGNSRKFPLGFELANAHDPQSLPGLSKMPRFVVLYHEMPKGSDRNSHWDLMLEKAETLATWALANVPESDKSVPCQLLEEHRKDYLEYEGPVSGNRGHVCRWDHGTFVWLSHPAGDVYVRLKGEVLKGTATLAKRGENWHFHFIAEVPGSDT